MMSMVIFNSFLSVTEVFISHRTHTLLQLYPSSALIICCAALIMGYSTELLYHGLCNAQGRVQVFLVTILFGWKIYHNYRETCFVSSYLKKLSYKGFWKKKKKLWNSIPFWAEIPTRHLRNICLTWLAGKLFLIHYIKSRI